jgi:hypothetical protein
MTNKTFEKVKSADDEEEVKERKEHGIAISNVK